MPSDRTNRKPFTRKGLHRLECQMCDGYVYATVAQLSEQRGLRRAGAARCCSRPSSSWR